MEPTLDSLAQQYLDKCKEKELRGYLRIDIKVDRVNPTAIYTAVAFDNHSHKDYTYEIAGELTTWENRATELMGKIDKAYS